MISTFILVLTIGVSSPITTITPFHSTDYDNPKIACETTKAATIEQISYTVNSSYIKAKCIQIPE